MSNNLNHYLQTWNLSDPQPLVETVTSDIYTVTFEGVRVVLKLLKPIGAEEREGALALRHWDGHGAVRLLRDDENAHLMEYAEGEDLVGLVESGQDEQATAIIVDVLNQLHSVSAANAPEGLYTLNRWFRSLFKKAEADRQNGIDSVYVRAGRLTEALLSDPRDVRVLHGDIHHENIRYTKRGWLAFDPKGLIGERTYDAANTLCNPINMPELVENEARLLKNAEILATGMGIELSRVLSFLFAYVCLSASWYLEDNVHPEGALRIAEVVEPHVQ